MRHLTVCLGIALLATLAVPHVQAQSDIIEIARAYPDVSFNLPLGVRFPDDGENKVYVAEFGGRVMVMDNSSEADNPSVFLDISDRIATNPPGEFFAVEFHPDYADNGHFFVRYRLDNPKRNVLSRFTRSEEDPLVADVDSEVVLFEYETPNNTQGHYGGDIAFGPDGYLYVPLGDGGVLFDDVGNSQNLSVFPGKVLRLDVDNPANGLNYGIPPNNPFVGNTEGWREEIFAYGLRNPWRLTIDRSTGDVWVGDVGESSWEEVNWIQPGQNYGWPIMEGEACAPFNPPGCDQTGLTLPVWAYSHDVGNSITGGYVYRGNAIPVLRGRYVYADFSTMRIWAIDRDNPTSSTLLRDTGFNMTTFGEDLEGELYFTQFFAGNIFKILPGPGATDVTDSDPLPSSVALFAFPNPSRGAANIRFTSEAGDVRLGVYDLLGRRVALLFDAPVGPGAERTVPIDTSTLAPGIYIVRLDARGETLTTKLVVAQ